MVKMTQNRYHSYFRSSSADTADSHHLGKEKHIAGNYPPGNVPNIVHNYHLGNGKYTPDSHLLEIFQYTVGNHHLENELNIAGNHHPGTSQNTHHRGLPGNEMNSDIWRMSRFSHRWHHLNSILTPRRICCNLKNVFIFRN